MRARRSATRHLGQGSQPPRGRQLREGDPDQERALRQKMRFHAESKPTSSYPDVLPLLIEQEDVPSEPIARPRRRAIVSIDGKDVDERSLGQRKVA